MYTRIHVCIYYVYMCIHKYVYIYIYDVSLTNRTVLGLAAALGHKVMRSIYTKVIQSIHKYINIQYQYIRYMSI